MQLIVIISEHLRTSTESKLAQELFQSLGSGFVINVIYIMLPIASLEELSAKPLFLGAFRTIKEC